MSRKSTSKKTDVGSTQQNEALGLVRRVTEILGPAPMLTAQSRQRSAKLRKGGEMVIQTVATLSANFGLTIPSHPTETMLVAAKQAESLIPLHKALVTVTKQVEDLMFLANSESWAAATMHYSVLKRLAKSNGDLETALSPVEEFFAFRSKEVATKRAVERKAKKPTGAQPAPVAPMPPPVDAQPSPPAPPAASVGHA
jgi:hypothetical protein